MSILKDLDIRVTKNGREYKVNHAHIGKNFVDNNEKLLLIVNVEDRVGNTNTFQLKEFDNVVINTNDLQKLLGLIMDTRSIRKYNEVIY